LPDITSVHLVSDVSKVVDEYFKLDQTLPISGTNYSDLILNPTQTSIETNPTANVASHLYIVVQDCYGISYTVSLPMIVQHE